MNQILCASILTSLLFGFSAGFAGAADTVLITEFMAANKSTLADEDGVYPDWIELFNPGNAPVNLVGWSLTDDPARLPKWQVPATNLPPNSYLVVFASGKDRRVPGAPLHTSFNLSASGEYLALVRPDGTSIASAFSPVFPRQADDVSFGIVTAADAFPLLSSTAPAQVWIPRDDSLGVNWTTREFDASSWIVGINGVGYDGGPSLGATQGLVGYWNFDVSAALGRDLSTNNNVLTSVGGPTFSALGKNGGALSLNGSSAYLNAPTFPRGVPTGNSNYTVSAWIKPTATGTRGIIGWGNYGTGNSVNALRLNGANGFSHYWWGNDLGGEASTLGITIKDAKWHHVLANFDGVTRSLWLDGRRLSADQPLPNNAQPLTFRIGETCPSCGGGEFFAGLLDDVAVWNLALSSNQIVALAQGSTPLNLPQPGYASLTNLIRTSIGAAMQGQASSAYLRLPFLVTNAAALSKLTLKIRYDDGFVAYLNGVEIARGNVSGAPVFDTQASNARASYEPLYAEEFSLSDRLGLLVTGMNVLAIHGVNATVDDADFLILAELEARNQIAVEPDRWRYFLAPTPGGPNGLGQTTLGAVVNEVTFTPTAPTDADDIHIAARARPTFDPITGVTLHYRVMFSNEVTVAMADDGANGDSAAGDGTYGATIPASASRPGHMVRWFVTATDTSGTISRWPLFEDPIGSPEYFGTVIGNPAIQSKLPVLQYFIQQTNWHKVTSSGPFNKNSTNASVYYLGRFYDNVRVKIRGASSVFWMFPKQSLNFSFNPGEHFYRSPDRELAAEININALWVDKSYVRNFLSMEEVYRAAGVPYQENFFVLSYLNGNLHSVAEFVEEPDERFLRRHGLDPNGAYYKMYNALTDSSPRPPFVPGANPDTTAGVEKRTRHNEDNSDLQAVIDNVKSSNSKRTPWIFDNLDVPEMVNYMAASLILQDWDRYPKNTFMYRDTEGSKLWQILPWDADLSWGYNGWQTDEIVANSATMSHPFYGDFEHPGVYGGTHVLNDAFYKTPATRRMFLRRARTLLDHIVQPPGTPASQLKLEARLDALYALMGAEVELDKTRWGLPFGTNQTFAQALSVIKKSYLAPRRTHLFLTQGPPSGLIPASQFPYPSLNFGGIEFNPGPNQAQEFICLTNSGTADLDISGWRMEGAVQFTFRPGTVILATNALYVVADLNAFRTRTTGPRGGLGLFAVGNYQGQLSARGESLRLFDSINRLIQDTNYVGAPSLAQRFLRIAELDYHPVPLPGNASDAQAFEFIELKNVSSSQILDLTGIRLANGVLFDFTGSLATSLNPGARVVVVKNATAFAARYGAGIPIAGEFSGSLDNNGERLQLLDASGEEILDFSYDNRWYPLTDGLGFSLVVVDETAEPEAWSHADNWRPSGTVGGSPGTTDPGVTLIAPIRINELLARSDTPPATDTIELFNPTANSVDISGWFLTDDPRTPAKYRLPAGTILAPGEYRIFNETHFNPTPGVPPSFAFSSLGDEAYLFSADSSGALTGWVHGFPFGPSDNGETFGRYVTGVGDELFVAQTRSTLGAPNASPRVGPLVFSEIMYDPPNSSTNGNAVDKFVELHNPSTANVSLFDPAFPSNRWKITGDIEFVFPAQQSLSAGAFLLLVSFDPATNLAAVENFRAKYGVPATVALHGPFQGKLNNHSATLELKRPSAPDRGVVPYVLVEQVQFRDTAPWPAGADGNGPSLQRRQPYQYANDASQWIAAGPSAGTGASTGAVPRIATQPASQTLVAFNPASLSVEAAGQPPLRYQWRFNGARLINETNAILFRNPLLPEQAGPYQVVVFNDAGWAISSNSQLTILIPPVITQQPTNFNFRLGATARFGVAATSVSGSPLGYQWRFNGSNLPEATAATLAITNAQASHVGTYDVLVTDSIGPVLSSSAVLTLLINPAIVEGVASQTVVVGSSVTLGVRASGTPMPLSYEWKRGTTSIVTNAVNSTVNFFTFTAPNVVSTVQYRVIVRNLASQTTNATSIALITTVADNDKDGLADEWEAAHGLNANDAADAALDRDGDGQTNGEEFIAGTDPTDPASYLKVDSIQTSPGTVTLGFLAVSNRNYSVLASQLENGGPWTKVADVVAHMTNRIETIIDSNPDPERLFYRLVTPVRR